MKFCTGFRAGRGTGTAALEAERLHDIMAMMVTVLFKVFLDIQNSYNTLDQDRCLGIIVACGVGPSTI